MMELVAAERANTLKVNRGAAFLDRRVLRGLQDGRGGGRPCSGIGVRPPSM